MKRFLLLLKWFVAVVLLYGFADFGLGRGSGVFPEQVYSAFFIIGLFGILYSIVIRFFYDQQYREYARRIILFSLFLIFAVIFMWGLANIIVCGFAVTGGRNVFTGECKTFPSTCIPAWYTRHASCSVGGVPLL